MDTSSGERSPVELLAEEFVARKRRGEQPSIPEYAARYPDLAEEIRELFPALLMVEDLGDESLPATGPHLAGAGGGLELKQLGDYRILREVGRGGMGVVYEAEQQALGRRVALKVLPGHSLRDPAKLRRFEREAKAAARLHHTNIVPVFGVGCHEGTHFYVMQFIQGLGLDEVLAELKRLRHAKSPTAAADGSGCRKVEAPSAVEVAQALLTGQFQVNAARELRNEEPEELRKDSGDKAKPLFPSGDSSISLPHSSLSSESGRPFWQSVARIGIQTAEALAYAHGQGVLHRDIKPSNLLLDLHGTVWVADFGLAKAAADGDDLTHTGDIVGTIRYMAPERFQGRSDGRSDLYSLGLTLYELLTLRPAFGEADRSKLVQQVTQAEPTPPRQLNPAVPRDLETIVLKAMAPEPAHRYPSAAELAEDLQRFVDDRPIRARRVSLPERFGRWCRRNPALASLTAAVALLLILVAVVACVGYVGEAEQRAEAVRQQGIARDEAEKAMRLVADEYQARQEARRNLYVSNLRLAQQAWEGANVEHMLQLLEEADRRQPGDEDLRGFEWHYLWRLGHPEVQTLQGHTDSVYSVAFSPDGQRLASASGDHMVKLWEVATGKELLSLQGHTGPVRSVAFSPDGQHLASGSSDRTVKLWKTASGAELLTLKGHTSVVNSVAFSPDGRHLASGSSDRTVKLWKTANGKELFTLQVDTSNINSVAFSPDGQRLASGSQDGIVKLWEVASGTEHHTLKGHTHFVYSVAFSPDGQRLASASSDRTVKLWEVASGKELRTLKGNNSSFSSVAFSPDGQRLASASFDRTVTLWEVATGKELCVLKAHTGGVPCVAFSPDGQRLVSGSTDQTVKLWETASSKEHLILKGHTGLVYNVAFSPDSQRLASGSSDQMVKLWQAATGKELLTLKVHINGVQGVAFSPDGQRLACASGDRMVKLWKTASSVAFSPTGQRLASGSSDQMVKVWEAATDKERPALAGNASWVQGVAFSPDGQRLASAIADRTVTLWEVASGKELLTLLGHTTRVNSVVFSPEGQHLASGGEDGTVKLWDVATGTERLIFNGHTGPVRSVAFSPDGQLLASASNDRTVKLWDVATGTERLAFKGHTDSVHAVAFSPDGRRLAAGSSDRTVKLWDVVTGKELLTLKGHSRMVCSVAFSPDGQCLASADDRTVRIWETVRVSSEIRQERALRERAFDLVESLYTTGWRQADVLQEIRDHRLIDPALRQAALALAAQYRPDLASLNTKSWLVVYKPGGNADVYRLALQQAEELCRLEPQNGMYLNTLGVAQYRAGHYEAAAETLARSEKLNTTPADGSRPGDLAFLAMAQYQLGCKEQAQATLARLREALTKPRWAKDVGSAAFLREAEALIESKATEPKK
jgi:WD40 repeat protein/serine/threonine protein kinase